MDSRGAISAIVVAMAAGTFSVSALAQGAEPPRADLFDSAYMVQVVGALLLVFGCLFGLAFVLKKLNGVPAGDRKSLRITSSVKVGAREKILLLDTGEKSLLVGVAAGNVRTLYVYENDAAPDGVSEADFSSVMQEVSSQERVAGAGA